jgi:arabinogalactan endo-1,4-beta-galactosidase
LVEAGGENNKAQNTYNMLLAVIKKVKGVPKNKGLGVMYLEPKGARTWSQYGLSAWGNESKPTKALDAFLVELVLAK